MLETNANWRLNGQPTTPLTVQTAEHLVRKVLAEAVDLSSFQQIFDPYDLLLDTTDAVRAPGAVRATRRGSRVGARGGVT